jgi:hypothetical protein
MAKTKKIQVLVLQPIRSTHPPRLIDQAKRLLARLPDANPTMQFEVVQEYFEPIEVPDGASKYYPHAVVRNAMLDSYLKEKHDYVLWIDSDLIDYDADLPTRMHEANPHGITAPLILLSELSGYRDRFYDIGGFIENGKQAGMFRPFFTQHDTLIDLDSVGCLYLIPADVFRNIPVGDGAALDEPPRYAPAPSDYYVEHWPVMQAAKQLGYRVCALTTARAIHAWLPAFGLPVN